MRRLAVNQAGASAGGDMVAGDKFVQIEPIRATKVEMLMERLENEIGANRQVRDTIDGLQFYYSRVAPDGVIGLEEKLLRAGREDELFLAFERKEVFAKALERYSLYNSAQRIFAYLLSKAEYEFNFSVRPEISLREHAEVNSLITTKIVEPIILECGIGPMDIDYNFIMGMIYWLAEQCFIRWH